jgi:multidrug resistance efflux pump
MQHAPDTKAVTADTLVTLLNLARRARHAREASELAFMLVNESHVLAPYRQAALWLHDEGVRALSGVSAPEHNAPFVQWLKRVAHHVHTKVQQGPLSFTAADLPIELGDSWSEWWPAHAVLIPLRAAQVEIGALFLTRDAPWSEVEFALLSEWVDSWLQAWQLKHGTTAHGSFAAWLTAVSNKQTWHRAPASLLAALAPRRLKQTLFDLWRVRWRRYTALACVVLLLPVRLTVLASGELVPANPAVIRAPLDGVVDQVLVQPNQRVHAGEQLFTLDRTTLESRLGVATQAFATSQAEYRQQAQLAVFDVKSKAQLATLQGTIAERQADVDYLQEQLTRAVVTAPRDGIVLFDDPSEWVGRPVSTGERMASIGEEHDVEVEAWLAPGDLISLQAAAPVTLYLNTAPLSPVKAQVKYVQYEATQRPDGSLAYRLRATLDKDQPPQRVGLKGTAKVAGERVPLVYWILRRPLAITRQFIGL